MVSSELTTYGVQWRFRPVDGKDDTVRIILEDGQNHPAWMWSSIGRLPVADSPVTLTADPEKQIIWTVQPIDNGIPDAVT